MVNNLTPIEAGRQVMRQYNVPGEGLNTLQMPRSAKIVALLVQIDQKLNTGSLFALTVEPMNGFAVDRKVFLAPINGHIPIGFKYVSAVGAAGGVWVLFEQDTDEIAFEAPDNESRLDVS